MSESSSADVCASSKPRVRMGTQARSDVLVCCSVALSVCSVSGAGFITLSRSYPGAIVPAPSTTAIWGLVLVIDILSFSTLTSLQDSEWLNGRR